MKLKIEQSWNDVLEDEFSKDYFLKLIKFVENEFQSKTIYPPFNHIFSAFDYTPFNEVKVVILGQDPYHGPNQANGLSFSVNNGVKFPPSLQNIYKELQNDLGFSIPTSGDLSNWAKQGVLMLNSILTVEASNAGSHQKKGWEIFTDAVIEKLANEKEGIVFILWGSYAQKKGAKIDRNKHCVIESAHPSPLSVYRGFWDSKPFSKTNAYLESIGKQKIDWKQKEAKNETYIQSRIELDF
ncbi:uracil-DNA glycosylase [Faecalibacter bovis]|uniref:Uracil-DNA glycosylase n=1 Tax=Faecalibacter bovis TaxID=2898187 RepID=A0ABX7XBS1_9FLAO|nr:uracil-DNA glycosylase [Faecalibacter bovis]QTV05330.1 uracil-DNA glycosylase [Faecalibacter bovis]